MKKYQEGGEVEEERPRQRVRARSSPRQRVRVPAGSEERPRVRVRAGSSPVEPRVPATQTGGSGPPAVPPASRVMAPAADPGRAVVPRTEGALVRQPIMDATAGPAMRDVPNVRVPPAALEGPPAPARTGLRQAASALGRFGRVAGPLGIAGAVAADMAEGDPETSAGARRIADMIESRNAPHGMRSEAVERETNPDAPADPVSVTYAVEAEAPRRRPRTRGGSTGRPRRSEADELNELSLRAIRGEPQGSDPREATIRRRMAELSGGMNKGGPVKEKYSKGGGIRGGGKEVRGRTKGRFI
jgi:hypothetical protein